MDLDELKEQLLSCFTDYKAGKHSLEKLELLTSKYVDYDDEGRAAFKSKIDKYNDFSILFTELKYDMSIYHDAHLMRGSVNDSALTMLYESRVEPHMESLRESCSLEFRIVDKDYKATLRSLERAEQENASYREDAGALKLKIAETTRHIDVLDATVKTRDGKISTFQSDLATSKKEVKKYKHKISKLKSELSEMEGFRDKAQQDGLVKVRESATLRSEVKSLTQRIQALKDTMAGMKHDLHTEKQFSANLTEQLGAKDSDYYIACDLTQEFLAKAHAAMKGSRGGTTMDFAGASYRVPRGVYKAFSATSFVDSDACITLPDNVNLKYYALTLSQNITNYIYDNDILSASPEHGRSFKEYVQHFKNALRSIFRNAETKDLYQQSGTLFFDKHVSVEDMEFDSVSESQHEQSFQH